MIHQTRRNYESKLILKKNISFFVKKKDKYLK